MRALSLLVLLALVSVAVAQPVRQDRVDEASVETAARALRDTLARAVREAGGDIERQHVHLILAFSTGHFNKDPLRAQAARLLAWYLIRDTLVEGDQLSCYAWELSLWDHRRGQPRTVTVEASARNDPAKQKLQDMFPTTVQDGSVGGHDTERAILEIVREVGNASDAVMVLITNDAQSVAPKGYQTIGTDNPEYQQVLNWWRRLPQVSQSGASQEVRFDVHLAAGGKTQRKLDVVVLTPLQFGGQNLPKGRADLLRTFTAPTGSRSSSRVLYSKMFWGLVLLAVAVVTAIVLSARKSPSRAAPKVSAIRINGQTVSVGHVQDGQMVCRLVAGDYPSASESIPAIRVSSEFRALVAEVYKHPTGIEVHPRDSQILPHDELRVSDAGTVVIPTGKGKAYEIQFRTKVKPKPSSPGRWYQTTVRFSGVRVDSTNEA